MADVLFGGDVSEDSDWGDDEPTSKPTSAAETSSASGSGGGGAAPDEPTEEGSIAHSVASPTGEPETANTSETQDTFVTLNEKQLAETPADTLAAVDVAGSAAYAGASQTVPVAESARGEGGQGCFYLVGLGLGDEKDITVNGLEIVRRCDRVFLEHYTAVLGVHGTEALAKFYGRPVEVADRTLVEQGSDTIFAAAVAGGEVAMLVVGDPFGATTHTDMFLRAHELGLRVQVVHNASIMNAVGCTGLQLYVHARETHEPTLRKWLLQGQLSVYACPLTFLVICCVSQVPIWSLCFDLLLPRRVAPH